jgi:hypothetical protein
MLGQVTPGLARIGQVRPGLFRIVKVIVGLVRLDQFRTFVSGKVRWCKFRPGCLVTSGNAWRGQVWSVISG